MNNIQTKVIINLVFPNLTAINLKPSLQLLAFFLTDNIPIIEHNSLSKLIFLKVVCTIDCLYIILFIIFLYSNSPSNYVKYINSYKKIPENRRLEDYKYKKDRHSQICACVS